MDPEKNTKMSKSLPLVEGCVSFCLSKSLCINKNLGSLRESHKFSHILALSSPAGHINHLTPLKSQNPCPPGICNLVGARGGRQ